MVAVTARGAAPPKRKGRGRHPSPAIFASNVYPIADSTEVLRLQFLAERAAIVGAMGRLIADLAFGEAADAK